MQEVSLIKKNFINYINKIILNKKVFHAYLIEISNYESDFLYVINFVKMILNDTLYDNLDENSTLNKMIDRNNYPDLRIIEPDGNWIKKNQLLDIKREFSNTSLLKNKRIYVIKNAEKLNSSSANTILKFLEEPDDNIIAILVTNNRYHVIDTILSRCQVLSLVDNLEVNIDDDIIDLLNCVINPNLLFTRYNYFLNEVISDKEQAKIKLEVVENVIMNFLNNKYCGINNNKIVEEKFYNIDDVRLLNYISIIEDEIVKLEYNVNYKLWIDSLFSRLIMEVKND